jgi:hypothetical protein
MHVRRRMIEGVDSDLESGLADERRHDASLPKALG